MQSQAFEELSAEIGADLSGLERAVKIDAPRIMQEGASRMTTALTNAGKNLTDPVAASFKTLGVTSQAQLNKTATEAIRAFNTIRQSGTATPQDIAKAWDSMQDKIGAAMGQVRQHTQNVGAGAQQMHGQFTSASGGMSAGMIALGNIVADVAQRIISSIAGMVSHVISSGFAFNSLKEQSTIAFTQLLGSSDLAKQHLAELFDLAARTPFESEGIIRASQRLQAMGFSARDVIPTLTHVADAVAGVGGGADVLEGVITALGQIKAKGKASAEEMLQLAERGIPAWEFLAKAIGKDIPTAMKLVEKGAISADVTIKAVLDGMHEKFGGLAEKQSKTWQGLLSTVSDVSKQVFGELTGPLFEKARDQLATITDFLPQLIPLAQEIGIEFNRWLEIFEPAGREIWRFFQQLTKSLNDGGRGFDNFRDGAEMAARVLSSGVANGFRTMTSALQVADRWLGKIGASVHDLVGFLNPLLGALNQLGKFGNATGLAPDRTAEDAWKEYRRIMRDTDKQLRDMHKQLRDAFNPDNSVTKFTEAAKKAKQTISEISPFLTERAIAGSPQSIKSVVDRFADTIVNQLNSNRDRVGEVGESVATMFLKRFESSLGGDKKNAFFQNIIDDIRDSVPEVEATMDRVVASLRKSAEGIGLSLGEAGLKSEQTMRSIIDSLRKQVGITDAMWKSMSSSQRQALDSDFQDAAGIYINQLRLLELKTQTSAVNQSISIRKLFADWRSGVIDTEQFMARLSGRTEDMTVKAVSHIDQLGKSVRGLSDRVSEAMGRIRGVMEETAAFQTQELFGGLLSQIETLSERSGIAVDILQEQFRVKLVEAVRAGKAGAQEALAALDAAILNSQLTKLESVWGQPLGRAIEFVLVQFKRLKSETVKQITAVGELFAALPDKLGGRTLNKIINEINTYVNLVSKALNVLEAFGVKLPEPLKKLQDILNGGAQSTTKIMQEMAKNVENILKAMSDEVIKIVRQMVEGVKRETDNLSKQGASSAQQFTSNFIGGIQGLPGGVSGPLNSTLGIFTGWGGRLGQVIQAVLQSIGLFKTQVPVIMNTALASTQRFALTFQSSMLGVGSSAQIAATQVSSAYAQMGAAANQGAAGASNFNDQLKSALTLGGGFMALLGGMTGNTRLTGIGAGLATGAQIGSMILPGVGTAIGAGIGALIGGLFSGKSELQKAQEAAALQQAKDAIKISQQQVLQAFEQTKQSWIETAAKLRDMMESIRFYDRIGKGPIKAFFKDAHLFFKMLAEEAKNWKDVSTKEIKKAAENLGAGVDLAAKLPAVFEGIRSHLKVPDISFEEFFSDADNLINRLGDFLSDIPKKIQKRIGKAGERLGPGVDLVPSLADALNSIFGMQDLPDEKLDVFERNTDRFIDRLGSIAQRANKGLLKAVEFLGEKARSGVEFGSSLASLIKSIIETPNITESEVDAFLTNVDMVLNKTIDALLGIVVDGLARSAAVAEKAAPIFSFLSGVGSGIRSAIEAATAETPDFSRLKENLRGAIQTVVELAIELSTEGVAAAGVFSEAGGKVMGFLSNVGGTMKSLDEIFRVQFDYGFIKEASRSLIELVIALAREMDEEGVSAASKYATATAAVLNFVKGIGDAFKSVKDAGSVTVQMVLDFVNGQKFVVDRLALIAKELGPEGIALAAKTAEQLATIVTNSLKAIDFYNAVAKAEMVGAEKWDLWVSNISAMVDALRRGVSLTETGLSLSLKLKDNVAAIRDNAQAAFNNLLGLANAALSNLTAGSNLNLNLSPSFATPGGGFAPGPDAGQSFAAREATSLTVVLAPGSVVVQGSLVQQGALEDAIEDGVVRAIDKAKRRGRIQLATLE